MTGGSGGDTVCDFRKTPPPTVATAHARTHVTTSPRRRADPPRPDVVPATTCVPRDVTATRRGRARPAEVSVFRPARRDPVRSDVSATSPAGVRAAVRLRFGDRVGSRDPAVVTPVESPGTVGADVV